MRAEGSAGLASAGVSLGGIINIVLDPFFVLPQFLGLGAEGAGLATAISNGIGTLFLLTCIFTDAATPWSHCGLAACAIHQNISAIS